MRIFVCAGLFVLALSSAQPAIAGEPARWRPSPGVTWQVQFSGRLDTSVDARVFDLDLFDTPARTVASLHRRGRRVVCYIDAGSSERWRPDFRRLPRSLLGRPLDGWPGERWLDIRRLALLRPIMESRMDLCRRRGFDAIEFDNVDGYANDSGFPLRARHQLAYNRWLARAAHARGLSAALKNDLGQVEALEPAFDFAINEQCFQYRECGRLRPFTRAGKAVLNIEYRLPASRFCPAARRLGFSSQVKRLRLDAWRIPCG